MWIVNSQNVKPKFLCFLTLRSVQQVCYMWKISLPVSGYQSSVRGLDVEPSEVEAIKRFLQPNTPIYLLLFYYDFCYPVSLQTEHWTCCHFWDGKWSRKNYKILNCSENKAVWLQSWLHLCIEAWVMIYITNIRVLEVNSEIRLC